MYRSLFTMCALVEGPVPVLPDGGVIRNFKQDLEENAGFYQIVESGIRSHGVMRESNVLYSGASGICAGIFIVFR